MFFKDLRFKAIHLQVASGRKSGNTGADDIDFCFCHKNMINFILGETLCVLCEPLWFNDLNFTTKDSKGFTKIHKGFLVNPYSGGG